MVTYFRAGQVVVGDALLDEEPEDGGRRAEGGDAVLFDHVKDVGGDELVKIVDKNAGPGQPLSVELAPDRLSPAGLGQSQMDAVGVHVVPVDGRDDVGQGVLVAVEDHLGLPRGAGGEVHQHPVGVEDGDPFHDGGLLLDLLVKVHVARATRPWWRT